MPERGPKTLTVPYQSSEQRLEFFSAWSKLFPVAIGDHGRKTVISLWPSDKVTIVKWSGGISAHPSPKNAECKNPLENYSPQFFGIKTASSSLIIFQRAELSTRNINQLWWCNWRTFWRINSAGNSPRVSCFCTTMPRLTGDLQKKLVYLGFQCLDHPPYSPDRTPSDYHLFSWLKKKTIESSLFFVRSGGHCCRGYLVGRTTCWIFFEWQVREMG